MRISSQKNKTSKVDDKSGDGDSKEIDFDQFFKSLEADRDMQQKEQSVEETELSETYTSMTQDLSEIPDT